MEIKQYLLDRNYPILDIKRLYKRKAKNLVATAYIKVDFSDITRPSELKIGYTLYKVSDYHPPPMQCFKCQRFGHKSAACSASKHRCVYCSENHTLDACPKQNMCCANCGSSSHLANYGGCPIYKQAKKIEALAFTENISYYEARSRLSVGTTNSTIKQPSSNSPPQVPSQVTQASSYASALSSQIPGTSTNTVPVSKMQSTANILTHHGFLSCLLIKLLQQFSAEETMASLLKESILSCNAKFQSSFSDNDLTSLINIAKIKSVVSTLDENSKMITDDWEDDASLEDFPLMEDDEAQQTFNSTTRNNKKLHRNSPSSSPQHNKKKKTSS